MTLHPQIAEVLGHLPPPLPGPIDPAVLRAAEEEQVPPLAERLPLSSAKDSVAKTAAGEVPVRIYTPAPADANRATANGATANRAGSYGLLVYFHGGAFFLGSLETHDHIARSLAKETGLKVISVGYRRAPENAYPAGLEDSYGVVRWAAENAGSLAWNGETLGLAGDSSGGNFVAAVAAKAHDDGFDAITHQVLFYPSLDLDFDEDRYPSLRENAKGYGLETAGLKPFNAFYIDSGADPADPLVSPVKRKDLSGLPAALIITAEHDPLRDEGELYGRRLQEAGVDATVSRYEGAGHGFIQFFSWIPQYHRAFEETAAFLGQHSLGQHSAGGQA